MNFNVIFNFCPKYYLKFLFSNSLIQKMTKLPLWRLKHLVMSGVGISTTEISFRVRKYHEKFSSWLPSSLLKSPQTIVLGPNSKSRTALPSLSWSLLDLSVVNFASFLLSARRKVLKSRGATVDRLSFSVWQCLRGFKAPLAPLYPTPLGCRERRPTRPLTHSLLSERIRLFFSKNSLLNFFI